MITTLQVQPGEDKPSDFESSSLINNNVDVKPSTSGKAPQGSHPLLDLPVMNAVRWMSHTAVLAVLGMLANVALTAALLVKTFSEGLCWKMGCWTAACLWGYMQNHFEHDLNAESCLTFSGDIDALRDDEAAVVIANHQGYADYYMVNALASRAGPGTKKGKHLGMLGSCRYFAKKSLIYLPVFGWAFWAVGMILITRNWTSDAAKIEDAFGRIKKGKHPSWIVSYLEGTRLSPRKVLQSQAFARREGKAELSNVLYPRTKGFVCTVQELRTSHVQHVLDLTFSYTAPPLRTSKPKSKGGRAKAKADGIEIERVPSLSEILGTRDLAAAGYRFHVDVRRIPFSDLPTDDEGLRRWVEDAWVRKDLLLTELHDKHRAFT